MGIISPSPAMPQEKGASRPQGTAVGSGPGIKKSAVKIETSAPTEPHTLGRAPPGYLK